VATHQRSGPCPDRLTYTRLYGSATRLGGWTAPTGRQRADALEELRATVGEDLGLAVEAAGVMLGAHPLGDASHRLYRIAADLLLEVAGVEESAMEVQRWIEVGRDRWVRARRDTNRPE
jgi:hypothetical protein